MTQEQLAEAAEVSLRAVSDLERGVNRTARRETARLLADALGLTGAARSQFEHVAGGRLSVAGHAAGLRPSAALATRSLPRDVAGFTGRESELRHLVDAASETTVNGGAVGIYAVAGMPGVGKTAFAVHVAHLLAPGYPDGQIFLPLHGHTAGQQPADPVEALAGLLRTAGVAAEDIPQGAEERIRLWRDHLAGKRMLIVLDDATGHEQVRGTDASSGVLRLLEYYLQTARAAGAWIPHRHAIAPPTSVAADRSRAIRSRQDAIRWFDTERVNLDAAAQYATGQQLYAYATGIPAAAQGFLRGQGHWDQAIRLMRTAADAARKAGDHRQHAMSLTDLGDVLHLTGDYPSALEHLTHAAELSEQAGDHTGQAAALTVLSNVQRVIRNNGGALSNAARAAQVSHDAGDQASEAGALIELAAAQGLTRDTAAAAASLNRALELCRDLNNQWLEPAALDRLAGIQIATGDHAAALANWTLAREAWEAAGNRHGTAMAIDAIGSIHAKRGDHQTALSMHQEALEIYRDLGSARGQARAHRHLAAALQAAGNLPAAADNLRAATVLFRNLADHVSEATLLNNLADLTRQQPDRTMPASTTSKP